MELAHPIHGLAEQFRRYQGNAALRDIKPGRFILRAITANPQAFGEPAPVIDDGAMKDAAAADIDVG